ncbi:flagellar biogenesis protein FliO [Ochrobactrum daejeonense]|uniref:Flagellar biogenesis protein FliO n=1 Tax=Brucella daejeonensis TaxID=659015 RepID=A0A7W9EL14_9HYPH|nr:twin transmembrane helix small protein [Brucella daejeonensis]MBB5700605.1 flagellar biogenesis protein FliO [Brucella daejeonensis]
MDVLFKGAAMVAMLAVAVVLIIGLRNMMRGGDGNFSNKMMQLRVFLQFIAVLLIVGAIYYARVKNGQ